MKIFKKKSLVTQETLGERLRKVRRGKNWTIAQAAKETRVAPHYIKALEEARYDDIPGEIYVKNFIRAYSARLGLDRKETLALYLKERHIMRDKKFRSFLHEIGSQSFPHSLLNPAFLKVAAICFVVSVVLSYLVINVYQTVAPPQLLIFQPKDNLETAALSLTVSGKSDPEAEIVINGESVIVGKDGEFEETVRLTDGLNLILISAKRKHGMERKITRHVLVQSSKFAYD